MFKRGLSFGITWKWPIETISIRCAGKQFHEPEAQGVVYVIALKHLHRLTSVWTASATPRRDDGDDFAAS